MFSQLPVLELQLWQSGLLQVFAVPSTHSPVAVLHDTGVQKLPSVLSCPSVHSLGTHCPLWETQFVL